MDTLLLGAETPIASGSIRDVYQHPHHPRLLVKVVRRSTMDDKFGGGRPWYKLSKRRYRHLIGYLREIREQLAVAANCETHPPFLQRIVGLAPTDIGLGLVVEAVLGRDGRCAPTLQSLIKSGGYNRQVRAELERFLEDIAQSHVIIADMHLNNIVRGYLPEHGDHFVLIDGIGFKTLLPLERWSWRINRWSNLRKANIIRSKVERLLGAPVPMTRDGTAMSAALRGGMALLFVCLA